MRGLPALSLSLLAAACNEPTGPSRKAAASDCAQTAAVLAQLEVGAQATAEQRTASATKHAAACEAARLTQAERECIGRATNTWSAIDCAPRMFPKTRPATKTSCVPVVARMRAAIVGDMPPAAGSAGLAMVDRMMTVAEASCLEDAWPEPFLACVMASKVGDLTSFKACHELLPKDIQDKVEKRMAAILPAGAALPGHGSGSGATLSSGSATPPSGSATPPAAPAAP